MTGVTIPTPSGGMPGYKEYPDAGHAFLNNHHDPVSRMMKIANIGYHEPSARDARRRIVTFFGRHLR